MLRVLNRDYKQSFNEALDEFPDCHFLMTLDNIMDEEGYIVAVSEEPQTCRDMCNLRTTFPEGTLFFLGGTYKHVAAIGIQNIVE